MLRGAPQWDWPVLRARCQVEARRLLRDPDDAEDAVQEALARAWRKRHTCHTPSSPLPWVLQITRNEALRLMGRRRDESDLDSAGPARELAAVTSTEDLAARVDVRRAVSRLTKHDRVLLHLRYGQDLKHNSIAALMDSPEGTVKVQLYRARERLRKDLTDEL